MPVGKKLAGNYPQKFALWKNTPAKLPPPPPTPPISRKIATRKITLKKAALLAKSITKVRKKDLVRFSKTFKIRFKFEYLKIA